MQITPVAQLEQVLAEMRAEEACSARDYASRHQANSNNRIQPCLIFRFCRNLRPNALLKVPFSGKSSGFRDIDRQ